MDLDKTLLNQLRQAFDRQTEGTVGLEEEVMLLDPDTLDLSPHAAQVVAKAADDSIRTELPACQLELVTHAADTVGQVYDQLRTLRVQARDAAGGIGLLAASGVHPFAEPYGLLSDSDLYRPTAAEYASVARRQLVCGLHIHVAIRGVERALAVYNELRSYLPELAALGASAPFYGGADTGLQSIRPKICENLPRQGIPPPFRSAEQMAGAWAWAVQTGSMQTVGQWWWELRLHPYLGTVEVRVCDSQPTVGRAAALAAVTQCLCTHLAAQHDDSMLPPPAPSWRIDQNRWSACRHGVHGTLADLRTGEVAPTGTRLTALLDALLPLASELSCTEQLGSAYQMIEQPAPDLYRRLATKAGMRGLADWMSRHFVEGSGGVRFRQSAAPRAIN